MAPSLRIVDMISTYDKEKEQLLTWTLLLSFKVNIFLQTRNVRILLFVSYKKKKRDCLTHPRFTEKIHSEKSHWTLEEARLHGSQREKESMLWKL